MKGWTSRPLRTLVNNIQKPKLPSQNTKIWNLNLDQIEAHSGCILQKVYVNANELGPSTYAFEPRTVLYSKLRPYLNKVVVADDSGFATTELVPLRVNLDEVLPEYLAYFLRSPDFLRFATTVVAGAKMPRMVMGEFWDFKVPLPPLSEQRRIAAILDQADALRAKRREALAQLDSLAQSIFIEMFGDPVLNPKGWPLVPLADSSERIQIGPFGSQLHEEEYIEGGIPLINPTHIQNRKIAPNWALTVSEEKYSQLSQYHLVEGDLVLGRRGEMGRCAIVTSAEQGWLCGTGSLFIRPNNGVINSIYLGFVISSTSVKRYLENVAQGVTMANLNKGIIGALPIPVPPLAVQLEFVAQVTSLEELQNTQLCSYNEFDTLFSSLQHRAFRGEL